MAKTLRIDNIEDCLECPLHKINIKEGYFYCAHHDSPEDHVLVRFDGEAADFELLEHFLPNWCPLPNTIEIKFLHGHGTANRSGDRFTEEE